MLQAELALHTREVRRLHEKLFYRPLLSAVARVPGEHLQLGSKAAGDWLRALGFADPEGALRHLGALTGGVSRSASMQKYLLPVLLQALRVAARTPTPACWPTARSARRSAATSGTCGCCATRARWPSGSPSCSAPASTSPPC